MLNSDANDRPPPVHERPTWLTYAQAAERLGLSAEAVRHRARRSGWRTQPGNDGRTLVLIPDGEVIDIRHRPPVHMAVQSPARTPDHQDEIARSNARAERAEARADEALRRADAADTDRRSAIALADQTVTLLTDAVARADRAEAAVATERGRADTLRDRLTTMQEQLADAHAALQAAAAGEARIKQAERDREREEQGRDAEHVRADALRDRVEAREADLALIRAALDQTQAEARKAHAEVETLRQADSARKGRGRLARLRAAWRGE